MINDTFWRKGRLFTLELVPDEMAGAPWEEDGGHGPVSDWTRREKAPGERVLCEDRGRRRFYDMAEAVRLARRDGWGPAPHEGATKGETAAHAAELDYQRLRAWCNDQWWYVGIVVSLADNPDERESLWGIESDDDEGVRMFANELADEILARVPVRDYPTVHIPELSRIGFSLSFYDDDRR